MCLGATLWSGVKRVVYGAGREDASRLNFEEGPVFPESYKYLEDRGHLDRAQRPARRSAERCSSCIGQKSGKIYNG